MGGDHGTGTAWCMRIIEEHRERVYAYIALDGIESNSKSNSSSVLPFTLVDCLMLLSHTLHSDDPTTPSYSNARCLIPYPYAYHRLNLSSSACVSILCNYNLPSTQFTVLDIKTVTIAHEKDLRLWP